MADGSYLDLGLKKKKRTVLIFDVRVQPQVEVLQGLLVRALRDLLLASGSSMKYCTSKRRGLRTLAGAERRNRSAGPAYLPLLPLRVLYVIMRSGSEWAIYLY